VTRSSVSTVRNGGALSEWVGGDITDTEGVRPVNADVPESSKSSMLMPGEPPLLYVPRVGVRDLSRELGLSAEYGRSIPSYSDAGVARLALTDPAPCALS